ncbi:MAG TPA: hypothetical protein PLT78_09460 [Ignavibacteriaceae bacterium]|nr:hypothetical protein [Ignavibacteriaceae bacterium]
MSKILSAGIKQFPIYFIDESQLDIISIPKKTLVIGQEFFGAYEIITTDGESVYQASNYDEAKFIVYSSKERNGKTYIPKDKSKIKSLVDAYNNYLDDLLIQIKNDYKKVFKDGKNVNAVSNEIFKKLNLIRY